MKSKSLFLLIFSLFLVGNSFNSFVYAIPGVPGDGTVDNPYLINYALYTTPLWKLNKIAKWVNKDTSAPDGWDGAWASHAKHFRLEADITTFTNTIGTETSPFMGTFDGNSHRIDVNIAHYPYNNSTHRGYSKGLFGRAINAEIMNITVTGYVYSTYYAGGILGQGEHTEISNCTNLATVACPQYDYTLLPPPDFISRNNLHNDNNALNGSTRAIIIGDLPPQDTLAPWDPWDQLDGGKYAGGIVGYGSGNGVTILNCANVGYISGHENIGGILGNGSDETIIHRCINIGTVRGKKM